MDKFLNSQAGLNLAVALARVAPPTLGYPIARLAAHWISSRGASGLVKAVRANQWVVAGQPPVVGPLNRATLDQFTLEVFENSARAIYELYHYNQQLDTAGQIFSIDPSFKEYIRRPEFDQRGLIAAGLHLGCFDLALQWILSMHWFNPMALTIPDPQGGRQLEFEIRKRTGLNLVPGTVNGLRKAIRYLQRGGMVVTGIDRPQADNPYMPRFFGRPANLPTHHIFLALKARVPVVLVICCRGEDDLYRISATPPIEMDTYPDHTQGLVRNAEKVLATAETFIRKTPSQWLITQPVWPDAVSQVSGQT
jgi:lauroyl/myristoyl acyltransferase